MSGKRSLAGGHQIFNKQGGAVCRKVVFIRQPGFLIFSSSFGISTVERVENMHKFTALKSAEQFTVKKMSTNIFSIEGVDIFCSFSRGALVTSGLTMMDTLSS